MDSCNFVDNITIKKLIIININATCVQNFGILLCDIKLPSKQRPVIWCSVSEFTSTSGSIHMNSPDSVNTFGVSTRVYCEITSETVPVRVKLVQNLWQQAEHVYSCEYTWKHVLVEWYQLWTSMTCANWFRNGSLFVGYVHTELNWSSKLSG